MDNNSFTVLPMTQRFSLEPGKTYEGKVSVINPADASADFAYRVSVTPYGVTDENYTADLVSITNRTQIVDWITIKEPTGTVKPNETKDVEFTITVPKDAPGGGQYATIAVSSDNTTGSDGAVAIDNIFELASLIYGHVDGEIVHEGEIIENNVPGFVLSTPITLSALISNNGNVHEDATFVIAVSNVFTGEVILPTEENSGRYSELIMPESTRAVTREVSGLPGLGMVRIKQTIYYQGDVSEVVKDVFICPIWFMVLVGVTLAAIVATIVAIIKKHKKAKTIEKA
ncbi:hypothetical protein IKF03_01315 [Candidatus Saccharibacteria bacterium]|nr:hypothetical protein [Candidatus Saccharibacteria bacterium]